METLALILAGGKGSRLDILSNRRSKPAMPFAGKYRIIDFALSNCSQSGIYDIAILTQYLPLSLNDHVGSGKPWDLDRNNSQVTLLQPHSMWYKGTADAVNKNLEFIIKKKPKYVLILSGDHIYKMDYRKMIAHHKATNARLTIACQEVDIKEVSRFGIMTTNRDNEIINFEEKPKTSKSNLASMGIYLFDLDFLTEALNALKDEDLDFGKHIIPHLIEHTKKAVYAYKFNDYWKDVGTYDSYLEANLEMIKPYTPLDLYDPSWKIFTKSEEKPPVKVFGDANIVDSLISNGCIIEGTVINSVLSPGVRIGKGSLVKDSIILNDTIISENVTIDNCIIDKHVVVGQRTHIGYGNDFTPNQEKPDVLSSGITVVEKSTIVPSDMRIGRNCRLFRIGKYTSKEVPSGSTIK
ncbi:Glucose-1-phosphate adenylyltransferase [Acholeplasma oculi]|uniref:Glucose-1-phosphate adenylyltransferase n=1 Tax=Acholeplasma oculi TaxID=35623 RepID=A0A061AIL5_9MOLU|nr:glucose-1-phosphate adenylyltransferase [Acholeplasma oculi]CDR30817.1 Glucose-1-phosphate adenylyltransferase [Acholeplasma oculi]SKC35114.1 glucose-1-phosphate adenylyltransferase [Acholeplasma oculi]SUT89821.1 Glucose-1-phosphate adenylyltransferase [Acholeplasma oculi]